MIDVTDVLGGPDGRVGFVGIGRMGAAMFEAVLQAGFCASVFDLDPAATAPHQADDRVLVATSAADVAARSAVIGIVVNTADQLRAACVGTDGVLAGARAGTIVLIHSTIDSTTLADVARSAGERGVEVLDAPVTGRWGHASVPELAVMVGGDERAFTAAKPVMRAYASLIVHLGDLGSGLDTKLALNLYRYLNMLAGKEAGTLLAAAGVDAPFQQLVEHAGANGAGGPPPPETQRKLATYMTPDRFLVNAAQARKDLRAAVARGGELGVHLGTAEEAIRLIHTFWGVTPPDDFETA